MTSSPNAFGGGMQLSLDLFPAQTFESILESRQIREMTVTMSPRLRRGWYVKMKRRFGILGRMTRGAPFRTTNLVVPSFLADAPTDVKTALIDWVLLLDKYRGKRRDDGSFRMKKERERLIFSFIESCGMTSPKLSRVDPRSFATQGRLWDLAEVFDTLNRTYFNGSLTSFVRWGTNRFRSYQSNKTAKNGGTFSLITIATMYNRPDTPRYAVEGIMFHEMLHIAVPPIKLNSRNIIHGAEFKRRERQFLHRAQWLAWEKSVSKRHA